MITFTTPTSKILFLPFSTLVDRQHLLKYTLRVSQTKQIFSVNFISLPFFFSSQFPCQDIGSEATCNAIGCISKNQFWQTRQIHFAIWRNTCCHIFFPIFRLEYWLLHRTQVQGHLRYIYTNTCQESLANGHLFFNIMLLREASKTNGFLAKKTHFGNFRTPGPSPCPQY